MIEQQSAVAPTQGGHSFLRAPLPTNPVIVLALSGLLFVENVGDVGD